jgi:hypothetical protein
MGVGAYATYLVLSVALAIVVGSALARGGRVFLLEMFGGNRALADAVSRLLTVAFYLFTLGFIALAMQPPGHLASFRQAVQLLSVKIGEVLLVLGAAHLASLAVFRRFGRRAPGHPGPRRQQTGPVIPGPRGPAPPAADTPGPPAAQGAAPARPRAGQDVH